MQLEPKGLTLGLRPFFKSSTLSYLLRLPRLYLQTNARRHKATTHLHTGVADIIRDQVAASVQVAQALYEACEVGKLPRRPLPRTDSLSFTNQQLPL